MEKQETMADFAAELEESYKTLEEYEQPLLRSICGNIKESIKWIHWIKYEK